MQQIILTNWYFVDLALLQIYSSVMIFALQISVVRNICSQVSSWIQRYLITSSMWSQKLQKLKRHTEMIWAVAFSQDDLLLTSASFDKTIRLWNSTTDQEVQKLKEHTDNVRAVTFL